VSDLVVKRKNKVAVKPVNRRTGRPSIYDPAYHPPHAYKFCLLGCTDKDLARSFDISESVVAKWKNEHEDFMNSIKAGRDQADAEVAQSLFHRAKGYSHSAEKIAFSKDGQELRADYVEHYPPDAASAIFWLKNRQRNKWRDTPAVAVGIQNNGDGKVSVTMNTVDLSQGYMQIISGDE
jgi:hypothetical protein